MTSRANQHLRCIYPVFLSDFVSPVVPFFTAEKETAEFSQRDTLRKGGRDFPANKLLMGEVIFTSPFISSFVSKVISPLLKERRTRFLRRINCWWVRSIFTSPFISSFVFFSHFSSPLGEADEIFWWINCWWARSFLPHPSSARLYRKLFLLSSRRGGRDSPGE